MFFEKVISSYGKGHYGKVERLFDYSKKCGHSSYITSDKGLCEYSFENLEVKNEYGT